MASDVVLWRGVNDLRGWELRAREQPGGWGGYVENARRVVVCTSGGTRPTPLDAGRAAADRYAELNPVPDGEQTYPPFAAWAARVIARHARELVDAPAAPIVVAPAPRPG